MWDGGESRSVCCPQGLLVSGQTAWNGGARDQRWEEKWTYLNLKSGMERKLSMQKDGAEQPKDADAEGKGKRSRPCVVKAKTCAVVEGGKKGKKIGIGISQPSGFW